MTKPLTPEVVPSFERNPASAEIVNPRIHDVEAMARWMDYAFTLPGGFQFGIAGVIGLIPGIGDVLDALLSLFIVIRAIQLGVPRVALARMLVNIGIESLAGSVPIFGDIFDVAFKANRRNYLVLRNHMLQPQRQRVQDWWFLVFTALILIASIALPIIGLIELAKHL